MLKKFSGTAKVKYIAVRKSKCYDCEIKLSYRQLEAIVEMGWDYSKIIQNKIKDIEDASKLALYNYKAKQILDLANHIAKSIGYSKDCTKRKKREEVGLDAFSAYSNLKK